MPFIFSVLGFLSCVIAFAAAFTIVGYGIYGAAFSHKEETYSFRLGLGFFLGSSVFLAIWRILAPLAHADRGLFVSTGLLALGVISTTVYSDLFSTLKKVSGRDWILIAGGLFFIPTLVLVYWLGEGGEPVRNWYHLGSCHGPRYANVAIQVFEENRIPVYGQDYEQSLLASIPSFFGFSRPLFALYVWLAISLLAISATTYGLMKKFKLNSTAALGLSVLLLAGNSALSLIHVEVVDNGFPLLFSGKVDLIRSVGSFLVFLVWLQRVYAAKKHSGFASYFVLVMLSISWMLSGIQDLLFAAALIAGAAFLSRTRRAALKELGIALGVLLGSAFIVSQLGGMMTRTANRDHKEVPGVINFVTFPAKQELQINPTVPFSALGILWADHLPRAIPFTLSQLRKLSSVDDLLKIIFAIELNLWTGIKTIFFPLLGLMLGAVAIRAKRVKSIPHFREIWRVGVVTFVVGFPINTLFDVSWYRWGFTRFMIPGYLIGSLCLLLLARIYFAGFTRRNQKAAWAALSLALLFGPVFGVLTASQMHLKNVAQFSNRVRFLVASHTYVP